MRADSQVPRLHFVNETGDSRGAGQLLQSYMMLELMEASMTEQAPRLVIFVIRPVPEELLLRLELFLTASSGNELGVCVNRNGVITLMRPGALGEKAGLRVNDRLVGLGETDVSGISDKLIVQLFVDFPPPVLLLGNTYDEAEPPVWKMVKNKHAPCPPSTHSTKSSASALRAPRRSVDVHTPRQGNTGFILDNPLTSVAKAMLAAGTAASFPGTACSAHGRQAGGTTVQGKQIARAIAAAPTGSELQILLRRGSSTRMISLCLTAQGLGVELHSRPDGVHVSNLMDGPGRDAGSSSCIYVCFNFITVASITQLCAGRRHHHSSCAVRRWNVAKRLCAPCSACSHASLAMFSE